MLRQRDDARPTILALRVSSQRSSTRRTSRGHQRCGWKSRIPMHREPRV